MELLVFVVIVAAVVFGLSRLTRAGRRRPAPVADLPGASAQAYRWIERLGASLVPLEQQRYASPAAREAAIEATGRYDLARAQLASAQTPYHASLAGRTALEGLHYVRATRIALDADPGADVPSLGPTLQRAGQVEVAGRTYYAAPTPSDAMPHFFPGGTVAGRIVPRAWYPTAWWRVDLSKTADAAAQAGRTSPGPMAQAA